MITRPAPVAPAKQRASNHVRRLAKEVQRTFPDMLAHQHLTDAAREIDAGRTDNAKRHLHAAIASFAPLQLIRHGVHDDNGHMAAKSFMQQAHRGLLLTMDTEHMVSANAGLAEHRKDTAVAAQQAKAMKNAQPVPAGRTGTDVAAPDAPEQPGSRQLSWDGVLTAIELATPPHETASGRRALAKKGQTAYGTSFPVPNVSYLKKAIRSIGRAPAEKRGKLKTFLKRRAKALGASALTANLTAQELAAIDLAVTVGHVIELYNPHQPRGRDGRWTGGNGTDPGGEHHRRSAQLSYEGRPGDMGHIRAIMAKAEEIRPVSDTAANALRNAGRALAQRQMDVARVHLGVAERVTRGTVAHDTVRAVSASLAGVPKGTYQRLPYGSAMAPRSIGRNQPGIRHGPGYYPDPAAVVGAAWDNVLGAIELSAQTGRLATTPHPFGKPGGPGLWDVKGMELPPYIQNIARALLRTGRAKNLSQAIAIAKGATNRWASGRGHVSPEVKAASSATNVDWDAKRARAHAHASSAGRAVELGWRDAWKTERRAKEGQWVSGMLAGAAKNPGNADVLSKIAPVMGVINDANASQRFGIQLPSGGAALLAQLTPGNATQIVQRLADSGMKMMDAAMVVARQLNQKPGAVAAAQKIVAEQGHANRPPGPVELTGTAAGAAKDQRVPAGSAGGGQFGSGGAAAGAQSKPQQTRAQRKAALLAAAKQDRAQAKLLAIRIAADRAALASASGKKNTGQKGAVTTAKAATTKSSAPAAKAKAAASPLSAASTGLSPQAVTKATAAAKAGAAKMSKAQLTAAIKAMTAQEKSLLAAAVTATQQAAKL
jgi:hypothetical protein